MGYIAETWDGLGYLILCAKAEFASTQDDQLSERTRNQNRLYGQENEAQTLPVDSPNYTMAGHHINL